MVMFVQSRSAFFLAIALCVAGLALTFAWYFEGISGEAFLLDQNGRVLPAPGASIEIYRNDSSPKSAGGYLASDASGNKKYIDDLLKVAMALRKAEQQKLPQEKIGDLFTLQERVIMAHCEAFRASHSQYFGVPIERLNADRNGRFSTRLSPGKYVIFVEGQAGNRYAVWLEDVELRWRSQIRLVKSQCDYSVQ